MIVTGEHKAFIGSLNTPYSKVRIFTLPCYVFYLCDGTEDTRIPQYLRDALHNRSPHNRFHVGVHGEDIPRLPRVKYLFTDPREGTQKKMLKILKRYSSQSDYILGYLPNTQAAETLYRLITSDYEGLLSRLSENGSLIEGDLVVGTSAFFRDMKK